MPKTPIYKKPLAIGIGATLAIIGFFAIWFVDHKAAHATIEAEYRNIVAQIKELKDQQRDDHKELINVIKRNGHHR